MNKGKKKHKKITGQDGRGKGMEKFGVIYPRSAGIDVGSMLMVVSYSDLQDMIHLEQFESYTESLHLLADLLKAEGVSIVTMESTGQYWKTLHHILEQRGIQVVMINPSHYRNTAAQKTDINDAQWLHQLLAHGLLRASHIALEPFRILRDYQQERGKYQDDKKDTLNSIHKILTMMNIKFQHLISDIEGVAGMLLLRAIASGERDPQILLDLTTGYSLKADKAELLKSFKGEYQEHLVSILKDKLDDLDHYKGRMLKYEVYIGATLKTLMPEGEVQSQKIAPKTVKSRKNQYHFNLKDYLYAIFGVDLTAVEGLDEIGLLAILSVTGTDMSKWPTAKHFASWLNLSPRPKITGGRVVSYEKRMTNSPATQAFRVAANSLWQSKEPLGQQYRKLKATRGSSKAIKAIARKLAVIFYNMVLKQEAYDKTKVQQDVSIQQAKRESRLRKEMEALGYIVKKAA